MFTNCRSLFLSALACLVLVTLPQAGMTATPADDPDRIAAARKLMAVMGVTRQMEAMMSTMKQSFLKTLEDARGKDASGDDASGDGTGEAGKAFDERIKKLMTYRDEMITDFARLYASHFTAKEMNTMAKFYATGTGAKFVRLMPKLMDDGAAIGLKYSAKMMEELKPE